MPATCPCTVALCCAPPYPASGSADLFQAVTYSQRSSIICMSPCKSNNSLALLYKYTMVSILFMHQMALQQFPFCTDHKCTNQPLSHLINGVLGHIQSSSRRCIHMTNRKLCVKATDTIPDLKVMLKKRKNRTAVTTHLHHTIASKVSWSSLSASCTCSGTLYMMTLSCLPAPQSSTSLLWLLLFLHEIESYDPPQSDFCRFHCFEF